jgi:glycosyltransferase involved in cell wall biosynthesis
MQQSAEPTLFIQIPSYNEEQSLPVALRELPRQLEGIGRIEWLVIDDGSTDRTAAVAAANGADHVIRIPRNRGLANAFRTGLLECLARGADIIVNTDADNQYCAADIPKLIGPILSGTADVVIGARPIDDIAHFSPLKKRLQKLGSWVVRTASGSQGMDAPSGFRAFSREAALRMHVFSRYTYTLETLIQAGHKGLSVESVPIRVNRDLRPSRLVRSMFSYVFRSAQTIIRIFILYRPLLFFLLLGAIPVALGAGLGLRWAYLYFTDYPVSGRTHVPSLVAAAVLVLSGMQVWVLAFLADILQAIRMLAEDTNYHVRKQALDASRRASSATTGGSPV